ncbi:phage gene 29 protein family protein [Nocardia sp. NPDC004711]
MSKIWRLEDIDPDDPEERFLPALQAIPIGGGQPMILVEPIARAISKHLTEVGCPPIDPTAATKKYVRPYRGEQTPLNGAAQWVPLDTPEADPIVIQDPAQMTMREREAQVERLRFLGYRINEPEEPQPRAAEVDAIDTPPRFDPAAHSVTEVCAYLRGLDDDPVEAARVVYAERHGKARNGILKRHGGGRP